MPNYCNCNKCSNIHTEKLYYTTRTEANGIFFDNSERINYVTQDQYAIYRGSYVRRMTDSDYKSLQDTKIHFSGERSISKNPISNIIEPQYYEKVLI